MTSKSDGSTASYYELPAGCTELQHLISYRNLNAQDGEMFRAIYRKGRASHSDELRDAKKVLFYAQAEVDRLEQCANKRADPFPDTALDLDTTGDERIDQIGRNGNDGEHYAEDISNPANWLAGDLVQCLLDHETQYSKGKNYALLEVAGRCAMTIEDDLGSRTNGLHVNSFRFHSRPSQVSEAEMSGIWHHWTGGEIPCDGLSRVEVEYRDKKVAQDKAAHFYWRHENDESDIIRYRML
jgi:hypothetical protein